MSFNKITIVGNLGRDPEVKQSEKGTTICSFSMATNEKRKDKQGNEKDLTTWFRITLFGKQAETAGRYLVKGMPVYIEGRLRLDEWSDKDGKSRYTLDVTATDMQFIGDRREVTGDDDDTIGMRKEEFPSHFTPPAEDDPLPF